MISIPLQIDRLVSATSASDAEESLRGLIETVRPKSNDDDDDDNKSRIAAAVRSIASNAECMTALSSLIGSGKLPASTSSSGGSRTGGELDVEEGAALSCELLLALLDSTTTPTKTTSSSNLSAATKTPKNSRSTSSEAKSLCKILLQTPNEGTLMNSLLDLLCNYSSSSSPPSATADSTPVTSTYSRVLALQTIRAFLSITPNLTQTQLLSAPDGMNRLMDLLTPTPSFNEEIRNEIILLLTDLASTSNTCARLILFGEGYDKALNIGVKEGGLTGGNVIVRDCLRLCLTISTNDDMGSELLLGNKSNMNILASMLDLRRGVKFLNPPDPILHEEQQGGNGEGYDDGEDDLDDILLSGGGETSNKTLTKEQGGIGQPQQQQQQRRRRLPPPPKLTDDEEELLTLILDLISVAITAGEDDDETLLPTATDEQQKMENDTLLKKRHARQKTILSHSALSGFIMELALYTHPQQPTPSPSTMTMSPYASAVPSPKLQCHSLSVMSLFAKSAPPTIQDLILNTGNRLERLMYLICTGGLVPTSPVRDKLNISSHALAVLRSTMSSERASLMVLHTLAPPMQEEEREGAVIGGKPDVPVVQKLVNTLAENLHYFTHPPAVAAASASSRNEEEERMMVNIVGSAGALGVFLTIGGATTREMLLRVQIPVLMVPAHDDDGHHQLSGGGGGGGGTLMDCMLSYLESTTTTNQVTSTSSKSTEDETRKEHCKRIITISLIRLLSEWIYETPPVLNVMFHSSGSISLGLILQQQSSSSKSGSTNIISTLAGLLLGLAMETMSSASSSSRNVSNTNEEEIYGGWSRSGIMAMIQKLGVSRYTNALETLKKQLWSNDLEEEEQLPWGGCKAERRHFAKWYGSGVSTIRKRVVAELTGSSHGTSDDEGDDDEKETGTAGGAKNNAQDSTGMSSSSQGDAYSGKSVKALNRLLTAQTAEMEALRQSLADAEAKLASQGKQLKVWKRRVESTPTQLDQMLTEYVTKTEELEKANEKLREEIQERGTAFEARLKEKDEAMECIQQELTEERERAQAVCVERDSMREEMEALSAAYANLEMEYNRVRAGGEGGGGMGSHVPRGGTAAAAPTREGDDDGQDRGGYGGGTFGAGEQPEGEVSHQQTTNAFSAGDATSDESTEGGGGRATRQSTSDARSDEEEIMSTLRAENARLLSDARRADEWMAMAYRRMEELGTQNAELQREVDTLRAQVQQLPVADSADADAKISELEDEIKRLKEDLSACSESLTETKANREKVLENADQLRQELDGARAEVQSLREQQQNQIEQEEKDKPAAALLSQLGAEKEAILFSKKAELDALQEKMEEMCQSFESDSQKKNDELVVLRKTVKSLQDEIITLQKDTEKKLRLKDDEIERRDLMIRELQGRMQQASQLDNDTSQELKEEVDELRSANEAAQDWMQKAVEHHNMLNGKIAELNEKNEALSAEIDALRPSSVAGKSTADELAASIKKSQEATAKIADMERIVDELTRDRDASRAQLESARQELEEKDRAMVEAREEGSRSQAAEIHSLKVSLMDREQEVNSLHDELSRVQYESQVEVGRLREELAQATNEVRMLRSELETSRSNLTLLQDQFSSTKEEMNKIVQAKYELESECEEIRASHQKVANELDSAKAELMSLTEERDAHVDTISDLRTKLTDFQGWTETAQQRIAELESERDASEERAEGLVESEQRLREELEDAQKKFADLQTQQDAASAEREHVESLIEQVNELCAKVDKLEMDKANLDAKNKSLMQEVKILENQNDELAKKTKTLDELSKKGERLDQLESELYDKDDALAEAEGELAALRKQMDEVEEQNRDVINQWKERVEELESSVCTLEARIEQQEIDANNAIAQWEVRCSTLDENVEYLKQELERTIYAKEEAERELASIENKLKEEIASSTFRIKDVEAKLEEKLALLEEQTTIIEDLQEQVEERDAAVTSTEEQIEALSKELVTASEQSEEVVSQWRERTEELESTVAELENTIEEQHVAANEAILQWEARCNALSEQIAEREQLDASGWVERVAALERQLEQYRDAEAERKSAYDEATARLVNMQNALDQITKEKDEAVAELKAEKEKHNDSTKKTESLIASMKSEIEGLLKNRNQLLQDCAELRNKISSEMDVRRELEEALAAEKLSKAEVEKSLSFAVETRSEAERELEKYKIRAERTLSDYKNGVSNTLLEERRAKKELEESLAAEKAARAEAEKRLVMEIEFKSRAEKSLEEHKLDSEKALEDYKLEVKKTLEETTKSRDQAISALEAETRQSQEQGRVWDEERRALEEKNNFLEHEMTEMREIIEQLQEELHEANDALQSRVTDEISERATEMATDALRKQINEMRCLRADEQEAFANEHRARLAAEQEVEKLKSDLALLASAAEESDNIDGHIRKLTSKAAEEIQRKERREMEGLRTALERAIEELAAARSAERDAEERAANSRLNASVCEQELIATKSDLSFLKQAMEEMRESEATAKSSLEYRIGSLEDDIETLMRSHADELESLKNELAEVSMEKERLQHNLSESEKANAALVYSASLDNERKGDTSERSEIVKLRLEKAKLLSASADEASRAERRIREAVAAQASSVEAELILERELREAAEASMDDMQAQMEELKARLAKSKNDSSRVLPNESQDKNMLSSSKQVTLDEMKEELQRLRVESEKMKDENRELRKRMEQTEVKAKASLKELTEKCRVAEAKARALEREGHFEAAVAAEITRLRAESAHSTKEQNSQALVLVDSSAMNGNGNMMKNSDMSAEELYEMVIHLKEAIKEERLLYRDVLAEHEDLLALLAQQDLERASLQSALAKIGGQKAVDAAIRSAEDNAVEQFGKYVRLR